jgi:dsRNA-specific ribonuclease
MLTLAEIKATAPNLFERAMTTPSWLNENGMWGLPKRTLRKVSRIQLAWIGDRILERVVRSVIQRGYEHLVSAKHLFIVGEKLGIFSYLNCGNGEKTQYWTRCRQNNPKKGCGPMPRRLISESVEAIIAVIYLIHGYQRATEFVKNAVIRPYHAKIALCSLCETMST